jgi:hypothetical protein
MWRELVCSTSTRRCDVEVPRAFIEALIGPAHTLDDAVEPVPGAKVSDNDKHAKRPVAGPDAGYEVQ